MASTLHVHRISSTTSEEDEEDEECSVLGCGRYVGCERVCGVLWVL